MLDAGRFVASKGLSVAGWLGARRLGVTATQVAKAGAGPGGFEQAVEDYFADFVEQDNPYMEFGRVWETPIAMTLKDSYGVMPNDWLIRHGEFAHHMATPDGISVGHDLISEIKTTGKDWNPEKLPIQYRRQVQWQMHCTDTERCVFAWMLRERQETVAGPLFVPGWFEPRVVMIERDEEMIAALIDTANRLWERVENG